MAADLPERFQADPVEPRRPDEDATVPWGKVAAAGATVLVVLIAAYWALRPTTAEQLEMWADGLANDFPERDGFCRLRTEVTTSQDGEIVVAIEGDYAEVMHVEGELRQRMDDDGIDPERVTFGIKAISDCNMMVPSD